MKSTSKRIIEVLKEMFTTVSSETLYVSRFISLVFVGLFTWVSFVLYADDNDLELKPMLIFLSVMYAYGLFCYFSRRSHPDEKPLIIWLKICIFKIQIWHKQAYLYFYPDLKKYRGNQKRKDKVWAKKYQLKKLKRELKELI
jgi:hypothetical protein